MGLELPTFTKCCFCFPMRSGLIAWAGFLMVTQLIMLVLLACILSNYGRSPLYISWLIIIILDFLFGFVLYIGALKSRVALLKVFYIYGILSIIAHTVIMVVYMFNLIVGPTNSGSSKSEIWLAIINMGGRAILEILLLIYIVLLVKSSIADGGKKRLSQLQSGIAIVS